MKNNVYAPEVALHHQLALLQRRYTKFREAIDRDREQSIECVLA